MASNTIKTRIQLKNDTEANWNKAINFVPKQGEMIVYSAESSSDELPTGRTSPHPFSRLKIGDGQTVVNNLPFINTDAANGLNIEFGTTQEWRNRLNYIPERGKVLIYFDKATLDNNTLVAGIKIGDGLAYGIDLPFIGDDIAETMMSHINDNIVHITEAERTSWNHKITCDDMITSGETLILTRN